MSTKRFNCRIFCFWNQSINEFVWTTFESTVDFLFSSQSINQKTIFMLSRVSQLIYSRMISTIIVFLFKRWNIALLKRKIEITHNNNFTSNHQINKQSQNIKQKISVWLVSFRFVLVSASLFATTTFSEFATTTNEFVSMTSKAHALFCSILYIFAININENESFTYKRYESNDTKSWKTRVYWFVI